MVHVAVSPLCYLGQPDLLCLITRPALILIKVLLDCGWCLVPFVKTIRMGEKHLGYLFFQHPVFCPSPSLVELHLFFIF